MAASPGVNVTMGEAEAAIANAQGFVEYVIKRPVIGKVEQLRSALRRR